MSQNSFQQMRQNFTKQRRRQQLQEIFRSKRKEHSEQWAQNQSQTFHNLLPILNDQNYDENRFILSDYARSTKYSYQMLPIVFIVYEYLLSHSHDSSSWQIITYLSDYEDFQIPQTQEFVHIIINYLNQDPQLMSQLLLNISKLTKCSLLCCRLIDASIVYIIEQKIQTIEHFYVKECLENRSEQFKGKDSLELQIHNFLFALTELFIIQPIIEIYQMNKICQILNIQAKSNRFLKEIHTEATFKTIKKAVSSILFSKTDLSHLPQVMQLLVQKFQPAINNSFFSFEEESIGFFGCCIKNKILLTQKLIKNLFISIKSKTNKNKVAALKVLQKILDSTNEAQKMQVEPNKIKNLQPLIDNKISISFEDFNSMFSSNNPQQKIQVSDAQIQNCLLVYSMLFTQKYESELKTLFQIFLSSGEKVKEEISRFIQSIIRCLIREIDCYEPNRQFNGNKEVFVPENMKEFLLLTVEQQELFYCIEQCLKSTNVSLVETGLGILKDLLLYFGNVSSEIQEDNSGVDFSFVSNQVQKFGIFITLENLMASQNPTVRDSAEDLLSIIDQNTPNNQ